MFSIHKCLFPAHLELVVSVLGAFMEGPIVSEAQHVVDPVEALDAVGDAVHLQHAQVVRHRRHSVDLQV